MPLPSIRERQGQSRIVMQPMTILYPFPDFQVHEPCEYFSNGKPSPTFNRKAHDRWGARHVRALDKLHEYAPPTHWATIKFNRLEPILTIKALTKSLTRAVGYHNRTRPVHLAMFGVHHIEADAAVHLHVLIRAGGSEPLPFLSRVIEKFNRKHGTTATVPYCEPPDDVIAVTHYAFKLGSKHKLLFTRNLGMRFVFQCGGYFVDGTKAQHERAGRHDFVLRKYEAQVDAVVCSVAAPGTTTTNALAVAVPSPSSLSPFDGAISGLERYGRRGNNREATDDDRGQWG